MTDGSRVTKWKESWTICGFGLALSSIRCEGFSGGDGRVVDKSLHVIYFVAILYVLDVFGRVESAGASRIRAFDHPCLDYAPDELPAEGASAGNGSGNERRDQVNCHWDLRSASKPRRCGPSPSRQVWTRDWGREDE